MNNLTNNKEYIDYKVYSITQIRNKYGFRVLLKFPDDTTQTIQRSGFRTKKEADENRNTTIVDLHNGTFVIEKGLTIKEVFTEWLDTDVKSRMTYYTYSTYKNVINNHIIKRLGKLKINDLNRGHVTVFYHDLAKQSHGILKSARVVLKGGIRYAMSKKLVAIDATKDVELPKQVKKGTYRTAVINVEKTLNIEQVKTLIEQVKKLKFI